MSEFEHMTHKFRPVLTLEQMMYISNVMQTATFNQMTNNDTEMAKSVVRVLVPMIAKVEVGAISPAYKLSETHAIKMAESARRKLYEDGLMSPQEETLFETEILGLGDL